MRLAQRAHGGYKRANILIIFRTANSEPCFLGLLSVTPENGACQHPVPLPTCFRTDSPRPSSPGPSQQGPQALPVPRLPSRSDPLRPGPFFPGRLFPGRLLPGRLLPGRFAPFGSHSGLRTISFRPSAGSFQRQLAVGPSSPTNRLMAVRGLRPVRVAGGRRNCWGTIFVRPSSRLARSRHLGRIQNLVPLSVPTPRSCGKSVKMPNLSSSSAAGKLPLAAAFSPTLQLFYTGSAPVSGPISPERKSAAAIRSSYLRTVRHPFHRACHPSRSDPCRP